MSPESQTALYCQHVSPKGRHCHMLLDPNSISAKGNAAPALCAYHANRTNASVATPDPEIIAADLLRGIKNFSSPNSVNRFLGHLVQQLARNASPAATPLLSPTSRSSSSILFPPSEGKKITQQIISTSAKNSLEAFLPPAMPPSNLSHQPIRSQ